MSQDANNDELLLNSDRIRAKFGSYGIDVLQDRDRIRVSSLYSVHIDKFLDVVKDKMRQN